MHDVINASNSATFNRYTLFVLVVFSSDILVGAYQSDTVALIRYV